MNQKCIMFTSKMDIDIFFESKFHIYKPNNRNYLKCISLRPLEMRHKWGRTEVTLTIVSEFKVPSLKEVNFGKVKLWHVEHFPTDSDLRFRRDGMDNKISGKKRTNFWLIQTFLILNHGCKWFQIKLWFKWVVQII